MVESDSSKRPLEDETLNGEGAPGSESKKPRVGSPAAPDSVTRSNAGINVESAGSSTLTETAREADTNTTTNAIADPKAERSAHHRSTTGPYTSSNPDMPISKLGLKPLLPVLPPSLELITGVKVDMEAKKGMVGEQDVGIIGYAGDGGYKGVRGVIKQR